MKKQIVITLLVTAFLGMAGAAQAGGGNRGYYNGNMGHYTGNRGHYNRPYRQNRNYGYRRGHNNRHTGLKIAAGALILGSAIYAANNNRYRYGPNRYAAYRSRPVVINRDYRFRVDANGQCVEVTRNRRGQEVWTYVDSSYCY